MYTRLLYATDLSSEHNNLTLTAVDLAKKLGATLYLVHVIELPGSIQLAQGLGFTELAKPAKDDAQMVLNLLADNFKIPRKQVFVEVGSVKEHLFQKVGDLDCQLLILGNHTPTGLPPLLGSTAHAMVSHAPCDILTLKPN
jgi:nucleotide-binding universal stress UspA family protein